MTDVPSFNYSADSSSNLSGNTEPSTSVGEKTEDFSENEFSLANPFLNGMPEEHRRLLAPYVKKWDGQVTKKFQDYANRVKPYEALGSAEELQKYYNFAQNFRTDPEGFFKLMWNGLKEQYGEAFQENLLRILEVEAQQMSDQQQEYDYSDQNGQDPNDVFQQNVMSELQALREWREQFEQSQIDAQGQEQLDNVLTQMHTQFGDFNDDFIILELSRHGDVNQAMKSWNDLIGKYSSQAPSQTRPTPPKIMGGQGGVPSGQVDTEKLRGSDRRQAVANMLAQLEQ